MTKKEMAARIAQLELEVEAWRGIAHGVAKALPLPIALPPTVNPLPWGPLGPNSIGWPTGCVHECPTHMYVPPGGEIACMKCGQRSTVGGVTFTLDAGTIGSTSNGGHAS